MIKGGDDLVRENPRSGLWRGWKKARVFEGFVDEDDKEAERRGAKREWYWLERERAIQNCLLNCQWETQKLGCLYFILDNQTKQSLRW